MQHPFRAVKRQASFRKVRYKGLAKNGTEVTVRFALANLVLYPITLEPQ